MLVLFIKLAVIYLILSLAYWKGFHDCILGHHEELYDKIVKYYEEKEE